MQRRQRVRALWIALIGSMVLSGVVVPLLVTADSGQVSFTATAYSDVIRFEAYGVDSLRVTIYDLSENKLWDSGLIPGDFADWDRANNWGERLANGYYVYLAQGWDGSDTLILNKAGKVVLLPGDQVQLKAAPVVGASTDSDDGPVADVRPMVYSYTDLSITGNLGIGVDPGQFPIDIRKWITAGSLGFQMVETSRPITWRFEVIGRDVPGRGGNFEITELGVANHFVIAPGGNVAIGTTNIAGTDKLTIEAGSGNLIACYPGSSRAAGAAVFRVEASGNVYADGTVYSAATAVGSADVAERINVSEWVEAGDVIEIDPEHVGFFRKAMGQYSRRVAGIISTSPGVILGNDTGSQDGMWNDNRPVLAIAGRVPVKVSTENGPIVIGDLLVSSSVPGIAMKGDPAVSIGAVVGKAMEPLNSVEGIIMAQVTLR